MNTEHVVKKAQIVEGVYKEAATLAAKIALAQTEVDNMNEQHRQLMIKLRDARDELFKAAQGSK